MFELTFFDAQTDPKVDGLSLSRLCVGGGGGLQTLLTANKDTEISLNNTGCCP